MALPKIIVALDLPSMDQARDLVDKLAGLPCIYKLGLEAFVAGYGEALSRKLSEKGMPVFVDLKMLDIPSTVSRATSIATKSSPVYLTIHAQRQALEAAVGECQLRLAFLLSHC